MRAGEGNAHFLADLVEGLSDEAMRKKHRDGVYGYLNPDFVKEWRHLAGRK